jgi:hypothetical protein
MTRLALATVVLAVGCGSVRDTRGDQQLAASSAQPRAARPNPEPSVAPALTPLVDQPALVARNFVLPPGSFAEANLDMRDGTEAIAAFSADGDLEWNVHSHPAGGLAVHQEGVAMSGEIRFRADTAGQYSYLWTNRSQRELSLVVSIQLPGGAGIDSWHPEL